MRPYEWPVTRDPRANHILNDGGEVVAQVQLAERLRRRLGGGEGSGDSIRSGGGLGAGAWPKGVERKDLRVWWRRTSSSMSPGSRDILTSNFQGPRSRARCRLRESLAAATILQNVWCPLRSKHMYVFGAPPRAQIRRVWRVDTNSYRDTERTFQTAAFH